MDEKERLDLKANIAEQIEHTEESVANLKGLITPIAPENSIGRLTRMDAIVSRGVNEEALRTAEIKLIKLKRAARRIDDNPDFGYCESCDKAIPAKRLQLMPESTLCVGCAV
ncbi:MAG: TraR/DksA C4-type zinc finger protein [Pseudomonadales bacterium]|nr:TraR/DksA C4-type zinc finger protein [Pseudomonadales bacterium]